MRKKLFIIDLSDHFLDMTSKAQTTKAKSKNKETNIMLHNEGNKQGSEKMKMKMEWKKYLQIIQLIRRQYSKYIRNSYNSVTKALMIQFKNDKGLYRHFSKEDTQIGNAVQNP